MLLTTVALFPLLYLTLELPKRIINDAIGAQASTVDVYGLEIPQLVFLGLLCCLFLLSVLAHGLLKMRINTMKGILSERLLRRLRYTLIGRVSRFPAPYFEQTSQGELVSMITSESEPMGGLMGDALAQPVLQAGQMATILAFLFIQSIEFGLAACALIPLQAWLIPKLQRRINLLNKERIQQVRALAAEIGEGAAGAASLRTNGGSRYYMAQISDRLGRLFFIRLDIFKKKFFMKFINNFITQLTPFFFYSIGGYLAIKGEISIGALVAALAAYKDIASPWKELLAYYNQTQDMSLRWHTITDRFAPQGMIDVALFEGQSEATPDLSGDIELEDVTVRDSDGNAVLEEINLHIEGGGAIGIAVANEAERRALAEVLTREVVPASGKVVLNGQDLASLHQSAIARRIGYASSRPITFVGSFSDNVYLPLKLEPKSIDDDPTKIEEAQAAGNSTDSMRSDWLDPSIAGCETDVGLRDLWLDLVEGLGSDNALFRHALDQKLVPESYPDLAAQIVSLRPAVAQAIQAAGLSRYVHVFDKTTYNPAVPVGDNLMFALSDVPITAAALEDHPEFFKALTEFELDQDLIQLAVDVIDMLRQIFGMNGTDHPLFTKLSLDVASYETAVELIAKRRRGQPLSDTEKARLIVVPLVISAQRIGPAFPEDMKDRVLAMRNAHATVLQSRMESLFRPLQAGQYTPGLTVLENALFGKVSDTIGSKVEVLRRVVAETMVQVGIDRQLPALIFDMPIKLGGANLSPVFAEVLAVSRAAIKKPDILVLDAILASFQKPIQRSFFERLRTLFPQTTFVYLDSSLDDVGAFDQQIELKHGRIVSEGAAAPPEESSPVAADLDRKLAALEKAELFSGLARKQLKLMAFGARWYKAPAGEYVFHKNDDPSDGAYLIIDGKADLLLPSVNGEDKVVATVGGGHLVGELGLIRNVPRALDMKANTDLLCLRIGAEEFLAVVENDASTSFKLLQVVAGYVPN